MLFDEIVVDVLGGALGVHYPGDVLAGVVLGLGVLVVTLSVRRWLTKPTLPLLALAAIPASGALVTGRAGDGLVLLGVICCLVAVYAWQTRAVTRRIDTDVGSYGRS